MTISGFARLPIQNKKYEPTYNIFILAGELSSEDAKAPCKITEWEAIFD